MPNPSPARRRRWFIRGLVAALGATAAVMPTVAPASGAAATGVHVWLTTSDQHYLLTDAGTFPFTGAATSLDLKVDPTQRYQTFAGAGASITETSASLLDTLPTTSRDAVMSDLFGPSGAGISFLRQPLGASDFVSHMPFYSYEDTQGAYDFSRDAADILPLIKQAKSLNPQLAVMGTPWTAPGWMKDSGTLNGGSLLSSHVTDYANYLAQVAKTYAANGVPLDSITPVNEPGYSTSTYPSMSMSTTQQISVVKAIDKAFTQANLGTKIWIFDHNWSLVDYAQQVLVGLAATTPRVLGAAFHCYGGTPQQMSVILQMGKRVRESECSGTRSSPDTNTFRDTLMWQGENLIMQSMQNGSETLMLWNLALNASGGPQYGNCGTSCTGVVTIANGAVTRNADYYVLGQVARFVRPGAVRVAATTQGAGGLQDVVWVNPDGSRVAILLNPTSSAAAISLTENGKSVDLTVPAGALATATWPAAP